MQQALEQFDLFGQPEPEPEPPPEVTVSAADLQAMADAPLLDPMEPDMEPTPEEHATWDQPALFEVHDWWEPLWVGMPEFDQRDLSAFCQMTLNFACQADLDEFAALIEQSLTPRTRSIWFPAAEIGRYANKRYISHGA
jgi:hypothetical protein